MLDVAPLALSNLNLAYNARSGTLDTRDDAMGPYDPASYVCSLIVDLAPTSQVPEGVRRAGPARSSADHLPLTNQLRKLLGLAPVPTVDRRRRARPVRCAARTPARRARPAAAPATRRSAASWRRCHDHVDPAPISVAVLALPVPRPWPAATLPGGAPHGPAYRVTADFADVLDLVPQAAVKVNDVTVGSVEKITLSGWNARVQMAIDRSVRLPANATAAIGQTSLLGEKFVALSAPADQPGEGTLGRRRRHPAVAHQPVGRGRGGARRARPAAQRRRARPDQDDQRGADQGAGRTRVDASADLLRRLDTFLAGLDAQKADIVHAIDALDRLSAHLCRAAHHDRATRSMRSARA